MLQIWWKLFGGLPKQCMLHLVVKKTVMWHWAVSSGCSVCVKMCFLFIYPRQLQLCGYSWKGWTNAEEKQNRNKYQGTLCELTLPNVMVVTARTVVIGSCMVGSCCEHTLLHFQGSPCEINLYLKDVLLIECDRNSIWAVYMNMYKPSTMKDWL